MTLNPGDFQKANGNVATRNRHIAKRNSHLSAAFSLAAYGIPRFRCPYLTENDLTNVSFGQFHVLTHDIVVGLSYGLLKRGGVDPG
jgi:hypothetical protein